MSVLYVRDKEGNFIPVRTIRGAKGDPGNTLANHLHNSNFLKFIAQRGINHSHANSSETYAGDRWIRTSGSFSATANPDGIGYGNATLTGTIQQRVESPPDVRHAGVSVLSGEATATYEDGVFTITGTEAVLDQAWLTDVESDTPPAKRGYSEELMECFRYFIHFPSNNSLSFSGFAQNASEARFVIPLPVPMRIKNPTYHITSLSNFGIMPGQLTATAVNSVTISGNTACMSLKTSGLTAGTPLSLKTNTNIDISADL